MISPLWPSAMTTGVVAVSLLSLIVGVGVGVVLMRPWRQRADSWMMRAVRAEDSLAEQIAMGAYRIPPHKAERVMGEIFRPMGVPSTTADVDAARFWRERRALSSRDHTTRHGIDDVPNEPRNDSWAAYEVLRFIGGRE